MTSSTRPLHRSTKNSMIAGVLGGLAEYFDLDPTMVRVVYVVVSILSAAFPGILVYVALWMIIPEDRSTA
jgi:phage shock protein C